MRLTAVVSVGLWCLTVAVVDAQLFTASSDLSAAFQLERQVVNVLGELVAKAQAKIDTIRKYLEDYESVIEEQALTEDDFMERVAGNPIHAYRLMKRLTLDWLNIENQIKSDDWRDAIRRLEHVRMGSKFPKEEDFNGAAQALIRLQDTYELNMTELARGNLWGRQTHAELTAQDCLFMGKHAFNAGIYARAIEWFQESYVLAGLENNRTVRQDQVMEFVQHTIKLHDASLEDGRYGSERTFQLPLNEIPATEQRQQLIRNRRYRLGKHISPPDDAANFNALCRGEQLLSDAETARLRCWYDNRKQPFFYLMPIKVELHSRQPPIYTFHQVISDNEIEILKSLSVSLLSRSMVQGSSAGHQVSNVRTSKTAWLPEKMHPVLPRLTRRIGLITGLETDALRDQAELTQVANYGIGGHYNPHHDYLMKDKKEAEVGTPPSVFEIRDDHS